VLVHDKGFMGSLFDFSFSSFVTTKIVKVLYVLAIVVFGLAALAYIGFAFSVSVGFGLLMLVIIAPLTFLLYVIYTRVVLELFIAIFRIMESNAELVVLARQANRGPAPAAPSYAPPAPTDPIAPTYPPTPPPPPG
jgi:hypothetical protein